MAERAFMSLLSPTACQGTWRDWGKGRISRNMAGMAIEATLRMAGMARLCLIKFRPLSSRTIALNLF